MKNEDQKAHASLHHDHSTGESRGFWRSRTAIALTGFLLIGGFLLVSEHRLHVLGYLPFLLVLACPLLHMFHGHGSHGAHRHRSKRDERTPEA